LADIRAITGYIAHVLLGLYWIWVVSSTAPQLRRSSRDRQARLHILLIKTAAIGLTTIVVGVIHFWATHWWHVIVTVIIAAGLGMLLRRAYRRIVATPRHRLKLTQRARRFERTYHVPGQPLQLPGQPLGSHAGRVSHRRQP
jgi:CHASE2 domain-containing sensor protein